MKHFSILAASVLVLAARCAGFSAGPGFFVPSNYELVKQADAIVLAEALQVLGERRSTIKFKIVERLKGDFKAGHLTAYGHADKFHGRSTKGDFSKARPGTYAGMGSAVDYRIGGEYLLFLTKADKQWHVGRPAQSRTQEEIDPADSPWLEAVRRYIQIAKLEDYEKEKGALKALRAKAAAAEDGKTYPAGLVADIDRHFRTLSPMKSYADLMDFHRKAKTDREKARVLYALARGGHKEALPLVRRHLFDKGLAVGIFVDYIIQVKDRESVEPIAKHYRVSRWRRHAEALVALAQKKHTSIMLDALAATKNPRNAELFLSWFEEHPSSDVVKALRKVVEREYQSNAKWHLTLALATMGDREVLGWAVEGAKAAKDGRPTGAITVIAFSPTPQGAKAVEELMSRADDKTLFQLFSSLITDGNKNPKRWDRLAALAARPKMSQWLVRNMRSSLTQRRADPRARKVLKILSRQGQRD